MMRMAWRDGEREAWLGRAAALEHGREEPDWDRVATGANSLGSLTPAQVSWLIAKGPDASARALLAKPTYLRHRQRIDLGRVAVARFELDAYPFAADLAGGSADALGVLLLPFRGPEPAALVAGWLRLLGSARLWARLWLRRHPEAAVEALAPAATGRAGRARQNAEDALRYLASVGLGPLAAGSSAGSSGGGGDLLALLGSGSAQSGVRPPAWSRPELLPPVLAAPVSPALDSSAPDSSAPVSSAPGAARPAVSEVPGAARPAVSVAPGAARPVVSVAPGAPWPADEVARLVRALTRSRLADPHEPAPGEPEPPGREVPLVVEASAAAQPMVAPPDPELAALLAAGDRGSLAAFGRALLRAWLQAGLPASDAWVILAQAHLGDEATWAELAPLVRSWPAKSRYLRAVDGHAAMATAGTDDALRHLLAIEHVMSGGPMNDRAIAYLEQAAARRGLTRTGLADRLALTHGLDAGIVLDYGPRAFTVVADEHLTLVALDDTGRRLPRPPKPGARDTDPEPYARFQRLKKEVRATVVAQTARLERDMLERRLRPAADLSSVLLAHPILGPLARRLVWGEYEGRRLVRALRIAEDGSFADRDDTAAVVAGDAPLGVVHPADLGAELDTWAQLFADYEIMQPFAQLNRPVRILDAAQAAATGLPGGLGPIATEHLRNLVAGRWPGNGYDTRAGRHTQLVRGLPDELELVVELEPGIPTGVLGSAPAEQRVAELWLDHGWSAHLGRARPLPFAAADPAALSELLVELYAADS